MLSTAMLRRIPNGRNCRATDVPQCTGIIRGRRSNRDPGRPYRPWRAEFRLPLLIGVFRFAALEAVIMNKAVSLVVVASALPFRTATIP